MPFWTRLKRSKKWRVKFNSPLMLLRWSFSKPFIVIHSSLLKEECEPLRPRSLTNILGWLWLLGSEKKTLQTERCERSKPLRRLSMQDRRRCYRRRSRLKLRRLNRWITPNHSSTTARVGGGGSEKEKPRYAWEAELPGLRT